MTDPIPTPEEIGENVVRGCFALARAQSAAVKLERATVTYLHGHRSGTVTHLGSRRAPINDEASAPLTRPEAMTEE